MNAIVDFYSNKAQHIKYKNYVIDHDKNIKILNISYHLYQKAKENNLKCYFTGSIAAIFQFKKVYKTIKDIDIMIEKEDLIKWVEIINSIKEGCGSYELFFSEETPFQAIENWQKDGIRDNLSITLTNYCSGITIDLGRIDEEYKNSKEIIINDLNIKYIPSEKFTDGIVFNRVTDIEDIRFLLQFEDAREFLLQFPKNKQIYQNIIKTT